MNIRKSIIYSLLAIFIGTSCTSDFDKLNKDPKKTNTIDINLLLPTATVTYRDAFTGYSGNLLFQSMWIQALASTSSSANYYSNGDKYVRSSNTASYIENAWNSVYLGISVCKQIERLIKEKGETGYENLSAASGILKVFFTSLLSDTYGDIPYSEALLAIEGKNQPKYDKQQELYPKLLADLEKAINAFSDKGGSLSNDILYSGKIDNWKKFGYSVMLHMAMRLTKVSPDMAKQWSEKAIVGGVFTSNEDSAIIKSDFANNYQNNTAGVLIVESDFYEVRWGKTFIDYMKSNNDPRLPFISEVPLDGLKANQKDQKLKGDSTASKQQGLPNGYDLGSQKNINTEPNYPGPTGTGKDITPIGKYSRPTAIYRERNGSSFALTYPEIKLLLAEAAVRGYAGAGDASQNYKDGTEAGMKILSLYGDKSINITQTAIDAYLSSHPLDTSSKEASMKMINNQYWATNSTLMNFYEAWNNWKRSGYPNLTPINFSGNFSGGVIPRRQIYPTNEASLNSDNYKNATAAMGGNTWITRVWWDKK